MTVRRATLADIPRVVDIYDRVLTEEESGRTATGWIRGIYPRLETAMDALNAGTLFVLERDGETAAAAKIDQNQVPEYANANWKHPDAPPGQVLVLHTLVVDPQEAGKGCGTEFVRFYEEYALNHGCHFLRMDTNARNNAARRLYARLGYREAGIVPCVFNGIPDVQLVCLEKTLKTK